MSESSIASESRPGSKGVGDNSNSYVSGLIRATGGSPSVNLGNYYGGATPLPPGAYTLRLSVDPRSYFPNATVELADSPGARLVPRPWRGAHADRPSPCGSYDGIAESGQRFEFNWACGDNANLDEYVVAFDVVGENLGVKEEALQFELKSDGIYCLRDSL